MSRASSGLRVLPPFLVGVTAATAAEVSASLLLYAGPGLVRSLTVILAVETAAFGLGLASAPREGSGLVEALRRRWLLCMVLFLGATLFSASWSLVTEVGQGAVSQGLGLALLGVLPLYGCGTVLATMALVGARGDGEDSAQPRASGAAAALGAAAGFVLTGFGLPQILAPASLFLGSLVLLSAAGLFYGATLDRTPRRHERARRRAGPLDIRVEDRHDPLSGRRVRLLLEGRWIRRWVALEEGDGGGSGSRRPWDRTVWETLAGGAGRRVLLVGGGASSLPHALVRAHADAVIHVIERSLETVALAREYLETHLEVDASERIHLATGNVEDLLQDLGEPYDLVLVDVTAFQALGGLAALSRAGRDALGRAVAPGGSLVVGPVAPEEGAWTAPQGWQERRVRLEPSVVADVVDRSSGHVEELWIMAPGEIPAALLRMGGAEDPPAPIAAAP